MDPPPPGTGVSQPMQGFGSSDMTTPFHYGSVRDGQFKQDSLEHKLKKQYWKTKQTVTQKFGKSQDEFVVAGDTDIDTKLEKAYHLQSSCTQLLQALNKYVSRLKVVSSQELVMGEYLRTWSEIEYTNAGEVMQNVGKLQESINGIRLNMVPALMRMYSEFMVFQNTALRDLHFSIQQLEKARTEYRAALLWMKDVSEKLENPDYRNQLARFRESQAIVKETKERYEKMKHDLSEKIEMVSASRCNLLSRSLPNYQKEVLLFNDAAANEFHKILVDLRSHHHHQYKVRRLAEEIRDLEAEESPFADEPELLLGERSILSSATMDDDDALLDVSNTETPPQSEQSAAPKPVRYDLLTLEKVAQEARVNDLTLSGAEAELRHLQDELMQPSNDTSEPQESQSTPPNTESTTASAAQEDMKKDVLGDLLQLTDQAELEQTQPQTQQDQLFDEWSNFSAFMPNTRSDTTSPVSGWEKEFTQGSGESGDPLEAVDDSIATPTSTNQTPSKSQQPSTTPESEKQTTAAGVDELLGIGETPQEPKVENTLLSDDLKSLGLGPPVKNNTKTQATQQNPMSLDSSYFSTQRMQHPPPGMMGQQPLFRSPLSISSGPIFPPGMMPVQQGVPSRLGPAPLPPSSTMSPAAGGEKKIDKKAGKDQDKASTSWMNVFAHLDPLVNEKA